jgi:hypothetical protein
MISDSITELVRAAALLPLELAPGMLESASGVHTRTIVAE